MSSKTTKLIKFATFSVTSSN